MRFLERARKKDMDHFIEKLVVMGSEKTRIQRELAEMRKVRHNSTRIDRNRNGIVSKDCSAAEIQRMFQ